MSDSKTPQETLQVHGLWTRQEVTTGMRRLIGHFSVHEEAERAAELVNRVDFRDAVLLGSPVIQTTALYPTFEAWYASSNAELYIRKEQKVTAREKALAKLTSEERVLLGLEK